MDGLFTGNVLCWCCQGLAWMVTEPCSRHMQGFLQTTSSLGVAGCVSVCWDPDHLPLLSALDTVPFCCALVAQVLEAQQPPPAILVVVELWPGQYCWFARPAYCPSRCIRPQTAVLCCYKTLQLSITGRLYDAFCCRSSPCDGANHRSWSGYGGCLGRSCSNDLLL